MKSLRRKKVRKSLTEGEIKNAVLQSWNQFVSVLSNKHQPKFKENCFELAEMILSERKKNE